MVTLKQLAKQLSIEVKKDKAVKERLAKQLFKQQVEKTKKEKAVKERLAKQLSIEVKKDKAAKERLAKQLFKQQVERIEKDEKISRIKGRSSRKIAKEIEDEKRFLKDAMKDKDLKKIKDTTSKIGKLEEKVKRIKKSKERTTRVKERFKKFADKVSSGDLKILKGKILKKPTAKGITPISARKTLRSFAQSSQPLVREVEPREIVQDNRSQFFRQEFINEERSNSKWLS